jgi:hypothetical protein
MVIPGDVFGLFDLFDADDLDMLSYPFRGEIDPAAITALFDFFLDHLLTVNLELGFPDKRGLFHVEGDVRTAIFFTYHDFHKSRRMMITS